MKKITAILLVAIMSVMCNACRNNKEPENTETKVETQTETFTMKHYQDNSIYFDHFTERYTFRMPLAWKDKCIITYEDDAENFYEGNSYDEDESGLLFSIKEYNDNSYEALENYEILYQNEKKTVTFVMIIPTEEKYSAKFENEYKTLKKGIHIPKATFVAFENE